MSRHAFARKLISLVNKLQAKKSRLGERSSRRLSFESLERRDVPSALIISEVQPNGSSSSYAADWFEVTNTGNSELTITGWKMDDNSNTFRNSISLLGVSTIAPGKSAVFIETTTPAATIAAFENAWFNGINPIGFTIGSYNGGSVSLSTGGDAVNLFDSAGKRITGVSFGSSTTGFSFDNKAGLGGTTLPLPTISTLSVAGVNGAFLASDGTETGSPGTTLPNNPPSAVTDNVTTDEDIVRSPTRCSVRRHRSDTSRSARRQPQRLQHRAGRDRRIPAPFVDAMLSRPKPARGFGRFGFGVKWT